MICIFLSVEKVYRFIQNDGFKEQVRTILQAR